MAVLVIHLLEAIEVEEEHGEFIAGQGQPLQGGIKCFIEGETIRQVRQRILPDRPFRFELPHDASRERGGIDEHAAQQHASVNHDQNGHQQIGRIAGSAEADGDAEEEWSRERDGRDRDGGEGERAAREHPGAETGDDQLAASGGIREECHRNYSPGGSENERVAHQPMHGTTGHELRLRDPA
jgi:hypothetical protein